MLSPWEKTSLTLDPALDHSPGRVFYLVKKESAIDEAYGIAVNSLNQDVKSNAVGERRPHNLPQMMRTVRGYLVNRRCSPDLVRHYFHEKSVRYAAA